jgi:hypothetical protein
MPTKMSPKGRELIFINKDIDINLIRCNSFCIWCHITSINGTQWGHEDILKNHTDKKVTKGETI